MSRAMQLLFAVVAISLIWLVVLPAAARRPAAQARARLYESLGVDVGAMVYTELDAAQDALSAWQRAHREHPEALWAPR